MVVYRHPKDEAQCLYQLHGASFLEVQKRVEQQFNTLHLRAQSLIGMATAVVTVTGFSGRAIAGTSSLAQVLVISGLFLVILGAIWVFYKVLPLQWVSSLCPASPQAGSDSSHETENPISVCGCAELSELEILEELIQRRNRRTSAYRIGGWVLCIGLFCYGCAISLMLLSGCV